VPLDVKLHSPLLPLQDVQRAIPVLSTLHNCQILSVVKGMTFLLARLPDLEALASVQPPGRLPALDMGRVPEHERAWIRRGGIFFYPFVVQEHKDDSYTIRTRMVFSNEEDPATGSAASGLATYLALQDDRRDVELSFHVIQGVEMGRRSDIYLEVTKVHGEVQSVQLSGQACAVMTGTLYID
jgi:PhzF family phenazine biosynthesis protein